MKDAFGNDLKIGVTVVYICNKNKEPRLDIGVITNIYDDECSVDGHTHILSKRVARVDSLAWIDLFKKQNNMMKG